MKDPTHTPHYVLQSTAMALMGIPLLAMRTDPVVPITGCNELFEQVSNDPIFKEPPGYA